MTAGELLLVRHAQAWCNVDGTVGGPLGCRGLTPRGQVQAKLLAERLYAEHHGGLPVDALWCSPRARAVQTAEEVAQALGLPLRVAAGLREQDLGEADGRPRTVLHADFTGNPVLEPWRVPSPGAESWSAYRERVTGALAGLLHAHEGERIVVVTHGEAVNAAHHFFLRLPGHWPGPLPVTVDNAAVTRWRRRPWYEHRPGLGLRWDLQSHNDTAHLATG